MGASIPAQAPDVSQTTITESSRDENKNNEKAAAFNTATDICFISGLGIAPHISDIERNAFAEQKFDDLTPSETYTNENFAPTFTDEAENSWFNEELFDASAAMADPAPEVELPELDAEAQQRLWAPKPHDEATELGRAGRKAARLIQFLEVPKRQDHDTYLHWLEDFFVRFPHPATFTALERQARAGLDPQLLVEMAELKMLWAERPDWWLSRRVHRYTGRPYAAALPNGKHAMTWRLSRAICESRPDFAVDQKIDEAWIVEWFQAPADSPLFWSFPAFLSAKVVPVEATTFHGDINSAFGEGDLAEDFDSLDWLRRAQTYLGTSLLSDGCPWTPYAPWELSR